MAEDGTENREVSSEQNEEQAAELQQAAEEEALLVDGVELEPLPLTAQVSALFFVALKPLSLSTIQNATQSDLEAIEAAIEEVKGLYTDEVHGFSLREIGGGYQFRTSPRAATTIKKYKPPRHRRLSKAAAETLAIIAYKQPVQRAEIENIRGVDALPTLKTLLDAKLIRIVGHENSVGQPALYGTTPDFLEVFGLTDLAELPTVRELLELAQDPGEVSEASAEENGDEFLANDNEKKEEVFLEDAEMTVPSDVSVH